MTEDERARSAAALVARIEAGDLDAEGELVERFAPGLLYLLRRLVGDPAWAEDLRQEAFAVALPKLRAGELREPEKLAGFLRSIAKNLARAGRRKERRRSHLGETPPPVRDGDDPAPLPDPADPGPDPLRSALLGEEMRLAERLLGELPSPRDREVLLRFCVAEEDRTDICTALDLPRSRFNLILFRARKRFRKLYEAALGHGEAAG